MTRRFHYHAFATAFAGEVRRPFQYLIDAQAPSALSPAGGYSSNRVEHFRLKEIISFRAAYTQVAGSLVDHGGDQSWDTVVTSTVEGLNIMGIVTADLIVGRLASRHGVKEEEASIIPLGSRIEGLRIAGRPVRIRWKVDSYSHLDTYSKAREVHDPGNRMSPLASIETSLVEEMSIPGTFLRPAGHTIFIPQFGTITLGQLRMDGNARQVTMLQVDPECGVSVACTAGGGQTNGEPVPPVTKPR